MPPQQPEEEEVPVAEQEEEQQQQGEDQRQEEQAFTEEQKAEMQRQALLVLREIAPRKYVRILARWGMVNDPFTGETLPAVDEESSESD